MLNDKSLDTLLIVDDNPENISVLFEFLLEHGFEILVAEDGEDAIQTAQREHPGLILLDVMMPKIDGFETCRRLKNMTDTKDIPVIFMTALSDLENKVRGFEVGAVDYVTKPFQQEEVVARINTHLTLRRLQLELEQKNQHLIDINNEKNELLGIAAHDLKNPLAAIQGTADFLKSELDQLEREAVITMLTNIHVSAKHMFELISNLLDVSRIEAGKISLLLKKTDIKQLAREMTYIYKERAIAKNINLLLQADNSHYLAYLDEDITRQVLDNLISNAVKYSPPGKNVTIIMKNDGNMVSCLIQDEGVGLSQQDQQKLFGKFTRLTPRPTGTENSTGLGLYIVKKLTEAMKGKVWCESELGRGSKFIVEFPMMVGE
jgi:signal transduction histidine kinase